MNFEDWLVGFIEGEGSFYAEKRVHKKKSGVYVYCYPAFNLTQKEYKILERVHAFFGVGFVRIHQGVYEYIVKGGSCTVIRDFCDGKLQSEYRKNQFEKWKHLWSNFKREPIVVKTHPKAVELLPQTKTLPRRFR